MKRKLKNYLIYPRFQILLITIQITVNALCLLAMYWVVKSSFNRFQLIASAAGVPAGHPLLNFFTSQEAIIYPRIAIISGVSILFLIIVSSILSHKLAGPIVKTNTYLKLLIESKSIPYELKFRKGDFFSELPTFMNEALKAIQSERSTPKD